MIMASVVFPPWCITCQIPTQVLVNPTFKDEGPCEFYDTSSICCQDSFPSDVLGWAFVLLPPKLSEDHRIVVHQRYLEERLRKPADDLGRTRSGETPIPDLPNAGLHAGVYWAGLLLEWCVIIGVLTIASYFVKPKSSH